KERADVGDLRRAGENEGQGTGGLGDRAQIALAYTLSGKFALHQVQAANHADDGFFAAGHRWPQPCLCDLVAYKLDTQMARDSAKPVQLLGFSIRHHKWCCEDFWIFPPSEPLCLNSCFQG